LEQAEQVKHGIISNNFMTNLQEQRVFPQEDFSRPDAFRVRSERGKSTVLSWNISQ
jgi:hypothetical protein